MDRSGVALGDSLKGPDVYLGQSAHRAVAVGAPDDLYWMRLLVTCNGRLSLIVFNVEDLERLPPALERRSQVGFSSRPSWLCSDTVRVPEPVI